ncbi:putative N-acetylated-alpha-linked acidic dipeptidase [Ptychodera flava]|uniref:putative N-acetylated-alpha-linked acidic dipeptidase n=1 Tax=Ptychodera flava TaxID=63121 RepID=UPI00396A6679
MVSAWSRPYIKEIWATSDVFQSLIERQIGHQYTGESLPLRYVEFGNGHEKVINHSRSGSARSRIRHRDADWRSWNRQLGNRPRNGKLCRGGRSQEPDPTVSDKLINEIKEDNIMEFSKYFTSEPHIAGREMDLVQAEYVRDKWLEQGLDYADVVPYKVLLSYPQGKENRVELIDSAGDVVYGSAREEAILDESQERDDIVPPFNAYSGAGVEEGDLVYANFATVEDFFHLERDKGINLTDKIIIAKYGRIFRGDKAFNAMRVGAKGLIIYSDPADVAPSGSEGQTYPDGLYLPGSGVQRGSLFKDMMDPLTPGYPSTDYAYRIDESEAPLPRIPVHPIGYDDAKEFMSRMGGDEVDDDDWKGGLAITYRYGPGFGTADNDKSVRLNITTRNQLVYTYNVIGGIRGKVDVDKYVLLGNHRDAWVFGAIDPNSGSAVMMEVSRAYGKLVKQGWRPRRSIIFCSWGAEEFGLIGSNEWVEEFSKSLAARAVVYLNLDSALSGTYSFRASSTPHLFKAVFDATKKVSDPNSSDGSMTVYDNWSERFPKTPSDPQSLPRISDLGSGSDYAPFMVRVGVSSVDIRYVREESSYPMYHSVYETFHMVSTYYDPEFKIHATMARVWAEMVRNFADSLVVPMDCRDYAQRIADVLGDFKTQHSQRLTTNGVSLATLENAIQNLTAASSYFHNEIQDLESKRDPTAYRIANDKLIGFERTFIDPLGLPDRSTVRHTIFAPSSKNMYASSPFPGLNDALFDIDNVAPEEKDARWKEVKKEVARLTHAIESAAAYLDHFVITLHRGKQAG